MPRPVTLLALLALSAAPATSLAQPLEFGPKDPFGPAGGKLPPSFAKMADVTVEVIPAKARINETVTVRLTVAPKGGAYTYPASPPNQTAPDTKNAMELPKPGDLVFIEVAKEKPSLGWKQKPSDDGSGLDRYSPDPVTWDFKAVVSPNAKPGAKSVVLDTVSVQVCDKTCVTADGSKFPPAQFVVEEGAPAQVNKADVAWRGLF